MSKEKSIVFSREFRMGQTVTFNYVNDLTGDESELSGIIKGFGPAVRKKWPEEMGEAPVEMMLVWRKDIHGNDFYHAVAPFEILDAPFTKEEL